MLVPIFLTAVAVGLRLIPHAPNIAPIGAFALFLGAYYSKRWTWLMPLLAMLASDYFIGFYDVRLMATVHGSFVATFLIGVLLKSRKKIIAIALGSLAGSIFFFLATNFAVWALSEWYPKTLDGLLWCYALALPFFKNTVMGDMAYTAVFFAGYELALALKLHFPHFGNKVHYQPNSTRIPQDLPI